jgi:hypothetical protein
MFTAFLAALAVGVFLMECGRVRSRLDCVTREEKERVMSRKSLDEILRYLQPFTKYEGIAIHELKVHETVHNKFPTFDNFRKILTERFQRRRYSDRSTSNVTLFERLQSLDALDEILSKPVIEEIQTLLEVFEMEERLRSLDREHRSSRMLPAEFHRSVLRATHGHIMQLHKILQQHQVETDWLNDYISACHQQMIREVRALSPLYPFGEPKLSQDTITKSADELTPTVCDILDDALRSAGVRKGRKELALQLTAVFCSKSSFFSQGFSAEALRQKIQRRERSRTRRSAFPS